MRKLMKLNLITKVKMHSAVNIFIFTILLTFLFTTLPCGNNIAYAQKMSRKQVETLLNTLESSGDAAAARNASIQLINQFGSVENARNALKNSNTEALKNAKSKVEVKGGARDVMQTGGNEIAARNAATDLVNKAGSPEKAHIALVEVAKESFNQCSIDTLKKQYLDEDETGGCWYCNIVSTMTSSYLSAVVAVMGIVKTLGLLILRYGFLIWLAYYIMQQVSSMAPIAPGKMLQEILVMGFKVLLATLAVNQGIPILTEFFLDPVMMFGIDYGKTLLNGVTGETIVGGVS